MSQAENTRGACLLLLAGGDMTDADMAQMLGIGKATAYNAMQRARRFGQAHIAGWDRHEGTNGRSTPIWRLGSGADKPRPRRLTKNEVNARSREKYRALRRVECKRGRAGAKPAAWFAPIVGPA